MIVGCVGGVEGVRDGWFGELWVCVKGVSELGQQYSKAC